MKLNYSLMPHSTLAKTYLMCLWLLSGSLAWADTVIVESRDASGATNSYPPYLEAQGTWFDSTAKSSAAGLTGTGSRFANTNSPAVPAFKVAPTLAFAGGTYSVEVTQMVPTSQSSNIIVGITQFNCSGLPATTAAFQRVYGNTWKSVGNIVLDPGQTTPEITFTYSSGFWGRFYSDSVRFIHQEQVIIETRQADGTVNSNFYQELQGNWFSSTAKSSAPGVVGTGVTPNSGSRYSDTNSAGLVFQITPTLLTPGGTYSLEVSQAGVSQSTDIVVSITQSNCSGLPSTTTNFQNTGGNTWKKIGNFTLDPGQTNPVITFSYLSGTLTLSGSFQRFYADAFRIVNAGDPCLSGLPQLVTVNGPLAAGQTYVNVPAVNSAAAKVTVYADNVEIGELTNGIVAGLNVVPTSPLVKGQRINASQTDANGVESCLLTNGPPIGGGSNPRLRLTLGIRQNMATGPIGANGGNASAPLKFLGATGEIGGGFGTAPVGGKVIYPSTCWQTVSFLRGVDPTNSVDPTYAWSASDGTTNILGDFGTLESVALCLDDLTDTGPYAIYIDNLMNGSTMIQNFESANNDDSGVLFSTPGTSLTTKPFLLAQSPGDLSPNTSKVSNANADTGNNSCLVSWQFLTTANVNWVRLLTVGSGTPNPEVDLRLPISFRILLLPVGQTNGGSLTISNPASQTNHQGDSVTFNTTATGTPPLTYQWTFNGTNISGATDSSLILNSVQSSDAGSYAVTANNSYCSSTSTPASLTVIVPPSIDTQPQSQFAVTGTNVIFSVAVSGTEPVTYQWQKNGTALSDGGNVSGATTTNLTLSSVTQDDAATYTVAVTNSAGDAASSPATLTVMDPPVITGQPVSQTNGVGQTVSFHVDASGPSLTYQWQKNGVDLHNGRFPAGANSVTLRLGGITHADEGTYTVVVSNPVGSQTSADAALTVIDPPVITIQPVSQTNKVGANVSFSVTATGDPPLSYQWQFNGSNLNSATNSALALTNLSIGQVGSYRLAISNNLGAISSVSAHLSLFNLGMNGGSAGLTLNGITNDSFQIQASDLLESNSWQVLTNFTLQQSSWSGVDTNLLALPEHFYRAVPQP